MALQTNDALRQVLNNLEAAVFVIDANTYEILFVNKNTVKLFGVDLKIENICWKTLQKGQTEKCSFCGINNIKSAKNGQITKWKCQSTINNQWYEVHDQLIKWDNGRIAHLEIAYDNIETEKNQINESDKFFSIREALENEKKYKKLYNLLKFMSDNAADMFWAKDINNRFTFVNKVFAKKLLNTEDTEEPIGKDIIFYAKREQKTHPDIKDFYTLAEKCETYDEKAKKSGKPLHFYYSGKIVNTYIYLDVYKSPLLDNKGKITGTVGYARDITETRKYQKELKDNVEKFRLYLNAMPVGLFIMDEKGVIKEVNSAIEKLLGKSEKELMGKNLKDFVYSKDYKSLSKGMKILVQQGSAKGEGIFPIGKNKNMAIAYNGLKLSDTSYLGVINDITAERQAKELLKLNEQRYRTVFENLPNIAVQAYDINRKTIFWNDTSTLFYGYTKEEVYGKRFEDLIIPDDKREWAKRKINEWLNTSKPTKPGEYLRKRKDGSIFTVFSSFIKIVNYHGKKEFFSLDIDLSTIKETENKLKQTLAALKESNKTKDKIFSIIGHDLRAPFNSLLGFTELLIDQYYDFTDEERFNMVNVLRKNSLQAFNLLNNILEWSRQQLGTIHYQPNVVFIKQIVDEVINSVKISAEEKQLTIENKINPHHFAYCDKATVSVIIRNIISNAIKFTFKNGNIEISSSLKSDKLWISIKDTGIGISRKNIEKILRSQGDYTTLGTQGEKGTGLGLMLSQNFIKMNKGELQISSQPGKGSIFSFSLPLFNK